MYLGIRIKYRGGAIILFILLSGGLVSSQPGNFQEDPVNDKCILCHADTYELSVKSHYQHIPFFERQCVTCHLRPGVRNLLRGNGTESAHITGTLVSQQSLWAKQFIYPASADKTMEHMVDLGNLTPAKQYRFRIILSETEEAAGGETMVSSWFGLAPREVLAAGRDESISCVAGWSALPAEMLSTPGISCPAGTRICVSWQTGRPLFARLQLQEMGSISAWQLSGSVADGTETPDIEELTPEELHDLLREPLDLAIDACYTCHPPSELGASHPLRSYVTGQDIKISPDLPTIDGMMTCVTCHDPHGSIGKQLIREEIKTRLCVACHYKFKGKSRSTMFN